MNSNLRVTFWGCLVSCNVWGAVDASTPFTNALAGFYLALAIAMLASDYLEGKEQQ